jgi:putative transposase
MFIKRGKSAALVLLTVGLAVSTYYDRIKRQTHSVEAKTTRRGRPRPEYSLKMTGERVSDEEIKEWLLELVEGEEHVYGYKLLAECLWRDKQLILNHKKSYRLCKELGILLKQRQKKFKHPRRSPKNHTVTGPNQLWQTDIKYGYAFEEAYAAIDTYMDFYNNRKMHTKLKRMSPVQFSNWVMQLKDRSNFHRTL